MTTVTIEKISNRQYNYRGVGFSKGSAKGSRITVFVRTSAGNNAVIQVRTLKEAAAYVDGHLAAGATVADSRICYKVVA